MAHGVRKMEKKLLFFDIDGTIITANHAIPESARFALQRAMERGHILMINTGRPYRHIDPAILTLPMSGYVCAIGGFILLDGRILRHKTLPSELCAEIRDTGYACGILKT